MSKNNTNTCNEQTFDQFFKSHAKLLRNYLYYKFGDLNQAEDLVQDSFIKLWNNCSDVPLEVISIRWLLIWESVSLDIKR